MNDDQQEDRPVRGFPAFPPRKGGRSRGQSWWGRAWTEALEDTSLDPEPLKKGRAYARGGHVGPITVSPGRIAAQVQDPVEDVSYATVVHIRELDDGDWERFLAHVAAEAGHLAALVDGEMPQALVEAAEDTGVRLLPGYGDLEPECDCDSWDHPCKHAAALCYQVSWLMDQDPFVLLLMRGRGEQELLAQLQWLDALRDLAPPAPEAESGHLSAPEPGPAGGGESARLAYDRPPVPLPPARAVPGAPQVPRPAVDGIEADPLDRLVAEAAARAHALLLFARGAAAAPPPVLDEWRDAVRIAAAHPGDQALAERLGRATGRPDDLAKASRAWHFGGPEGLDVLETAWTPPRPDLARARAALAADWADGELPEPREWRNRWTFTGLGLQLRYGRDGRWHPYAEESGDWWPAGLPDPDPAAALAGFLDR